MPSSYFEAIEEKTGREMYDDEGGTTAGWHKQLEEGGEEEDDEETEEGRLFDFVGSFTK